MTEDLAELKKAIRSSLDQKISIWKSKEDSHRFKHYSFVIVSIALSVSITIVGIFNYGTIAAILGAILAGILAFQQTFPEGDMLYFYRVGASEGEILMLDLDTRADTRREVEALEKKVERLIQVMAENIPRGPRVQDAIQKVRDEMRS